MSYKLTQQDYFEVMRAISHRGSEEEAALVTQACQIGDQVGYGNLIVWLNTAWSLRLMSNGMGPKTACRATHGDPYPIPVALAERVFRRDGFLASTAPAGGES